MFKFEFRHDNNIVTVVPYEGKMNSMALAKPIFDWAAKGIDATFRISHDATVEIKEGGATVSHTSTSAKMTKDDVKAALAAIEKAGGTLNNGNVTVVIANGAVKIDTHEFTEDE